jgi:hypothetical protein
MSVAFDAVVRPQENGEAEDSTRKWIVAPPKVKRVALIGSAMTSLPLGPYAEDSGWEIWGLSVLALKENITRFVVPRWDRWFELHDLEERRPLPGNDGVGRRWDPRYWAWLTTDHGKPLMIRQAHPEIPSGVPYPTDAILEMFPRHYFNCTVSWMLALAILEGATEIGLWGIDMALSDKSGNGEYEQQRPSAEYIIGHAEARGIKVYLPPESDLLRTVHLYGIGGTNRQVSKAKARILAHQRERDRLVGERQHVEAQAQRLDALINFTNGLIQETEYWQRYAT